MGHVLQETVGYFFCLEDRALLCRKCDVAVHTANTFVAGHHRFLLTGVRVGLEPTDPGVSSPSNTSICRVKMSEANSHPASGKETPMPLSGEHSMVLPMSETSACPVYRRENSMPLAGECKRIVNVQAGGLQDFTSSKESFTGGSIGGSIPQWNIDEFMGLNEFDQNFYYMGNGSSKVRL